MTEHLRRVGRGRSYNKRKRAPTGPTRDDDVRLQLPGQMELDVSNWKRMRKSGVIEVRPYIEEEDLTKVSVQPEYTPKPGDFIARDPDNPGDQWLLSAEYAAKNYESAD